MLSKSEIRTTVKKKMFDFDISHKMASDQKIRDNIYSLREYKMAETISSYVSKDEEVDTINIIAQSINLKKTVCVPLVIRHNSLLEMRKVQSLDDLKVGCFNILQPKENTKIVNPKDIELFFIPGIAFSEKGERIGRGGGYFDRFLSECDGPKIGLSYEFQVFDSLPVQKHDIKMDIIVTEDRVISFV